MPKKNHGVQLRQMLQYVFESRYQSEGRTLGELSDDVGVSKTYVSLFLAEKLHVPSAKLVTRIETFLRNNSLTPSDEVALTKIQSILDGTRSPRAIIATLANAKRAYLSSTAMPALPIEKRNQRAKNREDAQRHSAPSPVRKLRR
jgi:hypothetical protein